MKFVEYMMKFVEYMMKFVEYMMNKMVGTIISSKSSCLMYNI